MKNITLSPFVGTKSMSLSEFSLFLFFLKKTLYGSRFEESETAKHYFREMMHTYTYLLTSSDV